MPTPQVLYSSSSSLRLLATFWNPPVDPDVRLTPLPDNPIHAFYLDFISFLQSEKPEGTRAQAIYTELFRELGVQDPIASTRELLDDPPNLILVPCDGFLCHNRHSELPKDHIFASRKVWEAVELEHYGVREHPYYALAAQEVVKATIAHGLGHYAVHKALEERKKLNNLAIPENQPWTEVGEWVEFKMFGGLLDLDYREEATLQTSPKTTHLLTDEMLEKLKTETIIHLPTTYPEFVLPPSTSSFIIPARKKIEEPPAPVRDSFPKKMLWSHHDVARVP